VIAFTEAFEYFFNYFKDYYGFELPRQAVSVPVMVGLAVLILTKGANLGVKALYFVVGILFISLVLFFAGSTDYNGATDFTMFSEGFRNRDNFFIVFAIIFPAFTGMTAGVGLSGDLKNPSKSIPMGTTLATLAGIVIYVFIIWKLTISASPEDLVNDQLIMGKIAIGGIIAIPLGLAASTFSSALGSIMVAPRTLQALAADDAFPGNRMNKWLAKGRKKDGEPINASVITSFIAIAFVAVGNVNFVAEIISMFFMVTYGSLCLISFLNHFGSSPSYRPSFKSKWYISLGGFLIAVFVMFKINTLYAVSAIVLMTLVYLYLNYYHTTRKGLEAIFANSIFQLNRNLQVYLQKTSHKKTNKEWRPSAVCISKYSFQRTIAFKLLNWISYKYGFGTYMHLIEGYYSKETHKQSKEQQSKLISKFDRIENHVYIDTIISPSYTSAIAQTIQLPGISGMENNMVIFEFDKENPENLKDITGNYALVHAGDFDVCILGSSRKEVEYHEGIHVWIRRTDTTNANLMILLGFIISGHPDWKKSGIKIFETCKTGEVEIAKKEMEELVKTGRLPITTKNIQIIPENPELNYKSMICEKSADAGLTIIGFTGENLKHEQVDLFLGYESLGAVLFVNAHTQLNID
jgi:amino acid transporter